MVPETFSIASKNHKGEGIFIGSSTITDYIQEVKMAICTCTMANEVSASGPSRLTIAFFKLLFIAIPPPPNMTKVLHQLVFVPHHFEAEEFLWIKHRKVIYIPKKPQPASPSEYRPFSMLDFLYKIPSRIPSVKLSKVLPTILGPHQHGFKASRGIQEPSLLVTHLIQDTGRYNKLLQLVNFDKEKSFNHVGNRIIMQALRDFWGPEIMITATIHHYTLLGFAYVEVTGRKGMVITIKTSSTVDKVNHSLSHCHRALKSSPGNSIYGVNKHSGRGVIVGPLFYADCRQLHSPGLHQQKNFGQYSPSTYEEYTDSVASSTTLQKTTILCINTPALLCDQLLLMGMAMPENAKHLGLHLGKTIDFIK
jgi:hypothetical protein